MVSHCWLLGNGQELHEYAREGPTKKTAMEMAASAIATSGHCVGFSLCAASDPSLIVIDCSSDNVQIEAAIPPDHAPSPLISVLCISSYIEFPYDAIITFWSSPPFID